MTIMMRFSWTWRLVWLAILLSGPAAAADGVDVGGVDDAVRLTRHAACSGVVDREPTGAATTFTATPGKRLYLWCEVSTKVVPTAITHRYYRGERLIQEVPLAVRDHRWRTWSYHTLVASDPGEWRIEVIDEWGNRLAEEHVTVTAPGSP
jgi:hypothetical protein